MTQDQRQALYKDLAAIEEILENVATLLCACYDDQAVLVWRAREARGSVQRLVWALERQSEAAANGA